MASTDNNDENDDQHFILRCFQFISYPFVVVINRLVSDIHFMEQFYIKLYNIYAFVSQMFFFLSCTLAFNEYNASKKEEEFILTGLKTLLFYSVFTYFASKTRDILSPTHPSLFHNWNLTEGLCRIVIEWAKAIIVVICLREQGIYFKPSVPYAIFTFSYYLCTEKIFTEICLKLCQYLDFDIFDDLEHLYVPLVLNMYTMALSLIINLYLLIIAEFMTFTFVSCYFTIYIRLKDSYYNYWTVVKLARKTFENFRTASQKELEEFDDVCAVCLNKMSKAKITPCNHFFHPNCLKECLKSSLLCPICKVSF
ncbi:hypothetical protein Zmor_020691 [Zophobas morio]|uniref:RING-type domain-containing protein n=1 Tax=Zophobas morio TaxID=2755281 RepID=A0AA38M9X1_9CUCU|nr:hypothetical protein Zmor_020691 [Zophobas morio]